jgi:PAS domain S-box-containing protein
MTPPLSVAVVAFAALIASVFFNRDATSDDITAKSHGRADTFSLVIESILVIFVNTFGTVIDANFLSVLQVVCGVAWVGNSVFFISFHNRFMNRLTIAYLAVFTFATVCGLIAKLAGVDASIMFFPGAALAALCGIHLVDLRVQAALASPVRDLASAYSVDVRVRAIMERVSAAAASTSGGHDVNAPGHGTGPGAVSGAVRAPSEADCAEAVRLFEEALRAFPHSAALCLFAAQFHHTWTRNRHLMNQYLTDSERCGPSLDEQFWVYQVRRLGDEEALVDASGAFSAIGRVEFERNVRVAEENAVAVVGVAHSIWTSLDNAVVDLAEVQSLAVRLNGHVAAAERNFEEALALNPTSAPVLRSYAAFCAALHNTEKVQELRHTAQQVLDAVSKERDKNAADIVFLQRSHIDINAGACGVITLGGSWNQVGAGGVHDNDGGDIRDVNAEVCTIFGYSADALCGMDLWELFPFPLSRIFEGAVKDAGTSSHLLDVAVIAFGRHATGYCFPMLVKVARTGIVTVRRIRTRDHFVITVDSAAQRFSVVGTRRSADCSLRYVLYTQCALPSGEAALA